MMTNIVAKTIFNLVISYCAFFLFFVFYGGWQPTLRCISTTYYDKARMERHGTIKRGAGLLTSHNHMGIIKF